MAARKGPMRTRGMEGSSKEYQAPAGQTQDEQAEHQMPGGGLTAGVGGMSLVAMSAPMGGMPGGGMGEPAAGAAEMPRRDGKIGGDGQRNADWRHGRPGLGTGALSAGQSAARC